MPALQGCPAPSQHAAWTTLQALTLPPFGNIGRVRLYSNGTGVWRSLVARFVRDEEAVGSNPATPTGNRRDQTVPAIFVCALCPGSLTNGPSESA